MSTVISAIPINSRMSFEVYPSAQYGNNFRNVVLAAHLDHNTARLLGFDYIAAHQVVYPSLPSGVPNDPTQYGYVLIKYDDGTNQILGAPWIRDNTVVLSTGKKLTLVFDDIDEVRKDRIIAACKYQNESPSSVTFE